MTPCQRILADDEGKFTRPCPNDASGAIRIEFWAHKALQAMVPEPKPLQSMIINLRLCAECFSGTKPQDVLAGEALRSLESFAMQRNNGIVPDRSQTRLVHIPLDDRELLVLEQSLTKNAPAANEPQPQPRPA